MIKRNNDGSWDLTSDLSKESLINLSNALQAAAHEGVGNKTNNDKFIIRFNGFEIKIGSNIELWMFAIGLTMAFYKPIVKSKSNESKDKNELEEWDKAFKKALKDKKLN